MTINNLLADKLRKRQFYLLRHQASFRAEIDRYLDKLGKAVAANIISIGPSEPAREYYRRQRVEQLIEVVSGTVSDAYKGIHGVSLKEMSGLAQVEALYLMTAVNELLDRNLQNIALSAGEATSLVNRSLISGAVLGDWWDDQSRTFQDRFAQEMRMGILGGETENDLIHRVRGSAALGFQDGLMEMSRRKAKILIRGASSAVTRDTRIKSVLDNPTVFQGIQQVSVLDGRTSPTCISYAGKAWELPGYKPVGHSLPYNGGTPRHPNCRSTEIPVIREEFGGEPADDIGFDDFIATQPASTLDELLGKGRAQLYREKKITLSDLVDQNGRPLTLAQLREIH